MLISKGERRFVGFDEKIIAMYARGTSVHEIQGFLLEIYGTEVSPDFISTVTDAAINEVRERQQRPLEPMYPAVFFDALHAKIRDEGVVRNKAIYLALGVRLDGTRDVLGQWIEQTEGIWRSLLIRLIDIGRRLHFVLLFRFNSTSRWLVFLRRSVLSPLRGVAMRLFRFLIAYWLLNGWR